MWILFVWMCSNPAEPKDCRLTTTHIDTQALCEATAEVSKQNPVVRDAGCVPNPPRVSPPALRVQPDPYRPLICGEACGTTVPR